MGEGEGAHLSLNPPFGDSGAGKVREWLLLFPWASPPQGWVAEKESAHKEGCPRKGLGRVYLSQTEQLPGSKISADGECAPEKGTFSASFMH